MCEFGTVCLIPFCLTSPYHLFFSCINSMGLNPLVGKKPAVSASPRPTLIPFWVPRSLSPRHKMPMVFCWPKMARFGWCFLGGPTGGQQIPWGLAWIVVGYGVSVCWHREFCVFDDRVSTNLKWFVRFLPSTVASEDGWKITEYFGILDRVVSGAVFLFRREGHDNKQLL